MWDNNLMQKIVTNVYVKFNNDRMHIDKALGDFQHKEQQEHEREQRFRSSNQSNW